MSQAYDEGLSASATSIAVNVILAITKIITGLLGNSYALVADGIESTTDVVSSLVVWSGLKISAKPADRSHPYGHGKAESMSGLAVSLFLMLAAVIIAIQSIREILAPGVAPAWYTLLVLGAIIFIKETLFRRIHSVGADLGSSSLKADAWHHRSDAMTSLAAFVGIAIALFGGSGYESADDWAALIACTVIVYNAIRLFRPALDEVMDAAAPKEIEEEVRVLAEKVSGVAYVEKCRIRKSGLGFLMDIHVSVDGNISVREGHRIGHAVKAHLTNSNLAIEDVIVHIEPVPQQT